MIVAIVVTAVIIIGVAVCLTIGYIGSNHYNQSAEIPDTAVELVEDMTYADTVPAEEASDRADADGIPYSSSESDWSMISPLRFGSHEAFYEWASNNGYDIIQAEGYYVHQEGRFYITAVDVGDNCLAGRYHLENPQGEVNLDFNATLVGDIMYVQLGHDSELSHAVLRRESDGFRGYWGKNNKPMHFAFGI